MGYLVIGLIWSLWLEFYTVKSLAMPDWVWRERFFHIIFWPISLSIFVYTFLKGLW